VSKLPKYLNIDTSLGSNNMDKKTIFQELGFTDGEIKVYFALFELGQSTVGPISKKSGVTHAKVYPILTKLINKGLVSHVIKDGRKHFSATNPHSLLEFVDSKVRSLEEEKTKIKDVIPMLLAKQKAKEQIQYSRVYEGFGGLRSLFHELFGANKEETEICVLGFNEFLKRPDFMNFLNFYHDLRKRKKIRLKLILNKNLKQLVDKKYKPTGMHSTQDKIKYLDVIYPTGVFIFKDHVITIVADRKPTAFDIKSKQNAERFKDYFYSMWDAN
jgi:HTH-type transcriptional regulator, sugar sensing transcriptional regulator